MNIKDQLAQLSYYNNYSREFEHYYESYTTNKQKIDRIVIDSLQKGFELPTVIERLDQVWNNAIVMEAQYRNDDNEPLSTAAEFFEAYLRKVIRNIIVYDQFDEVFPSI